jgi:hypothetical protein
MKLFLGAGLALSFAGTAAADLPFPDAAGHPVVIVGEIHDNPRHHLLQADTIAALAPSAVVFEMLTADQASRVTPYNRTNLGDVLQWEGSGWPDFAIYSPVFDATGDTAIYGAAVPRHLAQQAFQLGAAAVFGPDAPRFGLDQPLSPEDQAAQEAEQADAHCGALPPEILPGFVAAQRLRDAELARVTLKALADTGGPVVVITGNGHARRDRGIPAYLAVAAPDLSVYSIGLFETGNLPDAFPFDAWAETAPAPRPDPCLAFE